MSDLKPPSRRTAKPKAKPAVPAKKVGKALRARTPKPVDRATMIEIFRRLHAANPEPKGELEHTNPYTLLVAVALSAQSTDVGVNKATRALFPIADTPRKDARSRRGGAAPAHQDAQLLQHQGEERHRDCRGAWWRSSAAKVPNSVEILETLPGVGRKTASVVVNIAFGDPRVAVDTHIFRVTNRIPARRSPRRRSKRRWLWKR